MFDFVSSDKAPTALSHDGARRGPKLLWGDRVEILEAQGTRRRVRARARSDLWVEEEDLGGEALLEVYFVDVGQGDGVLVVTPDRRHLLIDGGLPRSESNTGRNASDFVDWKFSRELNQETIALDTMIATHPDIDHFGGLSDLLDPTQLGGGSGEIVANTVTVEQFFHPGLAYWVDPAGDKFLGNTQPAADGGRDVLVDLLDGRASLDAGLAPAAAQPLQGTWGMFMDRVRNTQNATGGDAAIGAVHHGLGFLPGYVAGASDVAIRVLAPVLSLTASGTLGLRELLKNDGVNTNGHSVMLRLDYGHARILLTGDLNKKAQQNWIASVPPADLAELACDVAKACHHGAEDVLFGFLELMRASATVISSGDNEGHGHPRPSIVAASAVTGNRTLEPDGDLKTPLIYSTEIARSTRLAEVEGLTIPGPNPGDPDVELSVAQLDGAIAAFNERLLFGGGPGQRALTDMPVVPGIIYGLVNVRTNGDKILCATRDEANADWEIETFDSRF